MKIFMGPYKNWMGSYQLAELLEKVGVSEDRCDKIGDWLSKTWVHDLCEWVESKRKRSIKVRIDKYDTWSMDSTLAYIILPMLKQLKETKHGTPNVDDKDVPKELRSSSAPKTKNEWIADDNRDARWDWVLDEMIWAFSQTNKDWENEYYKELGEHHFEDTENNMSELVWDKKPVMDNSGLKNHQKRINRGFELFGKYYCNLWD